jgi:PAS domain S-box-containing protein
VTDYAIYLLDPSGITTTWNPGAQRIKGYTADEIIGQHFSRFYTEEDRKRILTYCTAARKITLDMSAIAQTTKNFERVDKFQGRKKVREVRL